MASSSGTQEKTSSFSTKHVIHICINLRGLLCLNFQYRYWGFPNHFLHTFVFFNITWGGVILLKFLEVFLWVFFKVLEVLENISIVFMEASGRNEVLNFPIAFAMWPGLAELLLVVWIFGHRRLVLCLRHCHLLWTWRLQKVWVCFHLGLGPGCGTRHQSGDYKWWKPGRVRWIQWSASGH